LLTALVARTSVSFAFPFVDPSNVDSLPTGAPLGTELPSTDVQGLQGQLHLTNPAAPGNPSAWTIVPRITVQEVFTDNALQTTSPRIADAITVVAPGINISAATARLNLSLDYSPSLVVHAVEGPLNELTQQLNLTGLVTIVPNLAYVDVRALSGVQSQVGGLAGTGTIGGGGFTNADAASSGALAPANAGVGGGNVAALTKNNEVQTTSFGISPYLLHDLGDYGTYKLGVSGNYSRFDQLSGFFSSPLPSGGINGSSLFSSEEIAHYGTSQFLVKFQDSIDLDLLQSTSRNDALTATSINTATGASTQITQPAGTFTSRRMSLTDTITYALSHSLSLFGSGGYQTITYSNNQAAAVNGLTWQIGFNYNPSPESGLSISYGHNNGTDAANAYGHIAIGGRSQATLSYTNTVGTQLENLQNQLNNSSVNVNGQLVNAITGGPNFVATNALGVQQGVYRFSTLTAGFSTGWNRDQLAFSAAWSIQTNLQPGGAQTTEFIDPTTGNLVILNQPLGTTNNSTDAKTGTATWTHQMNPDTTLSASTSYSLLRRSGGLGTDGSLSTAIGLQYMLSLSTSLSARYTFFDRVSKIPGYSMYQNMLLLGLTKTF
jgi:hypothetical protein